MGAHGKMRWVPVVAPVIVGLAFLALGSPTRALLLFAIAAIAAIAVAAGVDVAGPIARGAAAVGHGLGLVCSWLLFAVIIVPSWAWTRLRGNGLAGRRPLRWVEHAGATRGAAAAGSLGSATPGRQQRRGLVSRIAWAIGVVVLILGTNYALGWALDAVQADAEDPVLALEPDIEDDPRADLPAMAAYPWRDEYFADIQRAPSSYWPYTEFRPEPFSSPYLNIDGWTRQSYRAPGSAEGRPRVWMFGGSTTWGEGQRDDYTIASWLARLAEEAGTPIEIENYGQRGWTHFQEMILYEQRLALDAPPDLALFYDGVNELNTQALIDEPVPSHYGVTDLAAAVEGRTIATRFQQPGTTGGGGASRLLDDLRYEYSKHSLVHKVVDYLDQPAGAAPRQGAVGQDDDGQAVYPLTPRDGTDAAQVYERGKRLTLALSDDHDVETLLYWQPMRFVNEPERRAQAGLTDPTVDLTELLLEHQDVFIDGGHTNEEGARLVAEEIWRTFGPAVAQWYQEQG